MAASRIRRFFGVNNGRPVKHGLVAALVVGIIMATAGGSYAYWTTASTVTSTPRAATLVVTATAVSLNATYGNDTLTSTSYVSVRNDTTTASTQVPALAILLKSSAGDATLATATTIQSWLVASASACTAATAVPGSGVTTGNWAAGTNVTGLSVAKNATTTICVRSTIANRASVVSTSGTLSFTPTATATINVQNFAAATAASGTQSTQYIFAPVTIERKNWYFIKPQGQSNCLDVLGGVIPATSGTTFISYPCKDANDTSNYIWNQQWTFLAVDSGYAEIKPRSGTNLRVDTGASATSSLVLNTAGALGSDDSQEWMVQAAGSGMYQFVNRVSGLCMNVQPSAADVTQAACSAAATQRFTIESPKAILLDNVTCAIAGTGAARTLTYNFYSNDNGAYVLQTSPNGTTWTTIATTAVRTATVSGTVGGNAASVLGTTYQTRILDVFGTTVDTGTFVARSLGTWTCT